MGTRYIFGMKFLFRTAAALKGVYSGKFSVVANTVTAGCLGCVGDLLAQKSEQRTEKFEWDMKRTRNMTVVCMLAGPVMHYWYRFLDRKYAGHSMIIVSKKLCLDILSGPFWYGWYIGGLSLLKGSNTKQLADELKAKVPIIVTVDLALWPIFQGINFRFFAPQYRILVLKCNELVFDVIFSHIANNEYTFSTWLNAVKEVVLRKKWP